MRSSMSRPTGKSIYLQRREYLESMNKQPDNFQYRVEHLFTCELDGKEVKNLNDCVARLKRLDAKGRLWGQEMILEVLGGYLQLTDIETKAELESIPLISIQHTNAVLDSCAYNSLLTVTVKERNRQISQVFMFQCEEVGAEHIRVDLDKAVKNGGADVEPRRVQNNIRSDLENIIGQQVPGGFRPPGHPPPFDRLPERTPPPPDCPAPHWNGQDYEMMPAPPVYPPQEEPVYSTEVYGGSQHSQEEPSLADINRSVEILNHVLDDVELFLQQVVAATTYNENKQKKKKNKKKANKNADNLPHWKELYSCLQKVKYGFNLLGKVNGFIDNPTAPDYVHFFFSILHKLMSPYPQDLPLTVLTPLLTEQALYLLSQVVTPQEDQLWRSLGDNWNLPRSKHPEGHMLPPYVPQFSDGWEPPLPPQSLPISKSNSHHAVRGGLLVPRQAEEAMMNNPWAPPPPTHTREPAVMMRVIYDFMARNNQELSVLKGEVVEVVDKSKQWWIIRNVRKEEGYVPQNILEPVDAGRPAEDDQDMHSPPPLNMISRPADVKAWLEYKGFSKITVRSLGVLTGQLLLGMSRDEIRMACPEEGGRVFFQLQSIRSAIALASESGYGPYNGR
ncbi:epidermal growth factor receptor kinase substrate 8-like protein 3b [Osmerus mordax]|uniref:epidermal growth factor receptor kinase substrate 8-like protein 3b n=1 Tax=Osmerus mordax TaxID=8014 RepID=UPI00350EBAB8